MSGLRLLRSLARHRLLLAGLFAGELQSRYAGALGGLCWAVLSPLALIAVYAVVFSKLLAVPEIPQGPGGFGLWLFAGMVPWLLISRVAGGAPGSLLALGATVRRFRLPPALVPASLVFVTAAETVLALGLLAALALFLESVHSMRLLTLVPASGFLVLLALGLALLLAAANLYGRDVAHAVTGFLPFWFFATPIAYPVSAVPQSLHQLFLLNPLTGFVQLCRWALLDSPPPEPLAMLCSCVASIVLFEAGSAFFQAAEADLVDLL